MDAFSSQNSQETSEFAKNWPQLANQTYLDHAGTTPPPNAILTSHLHNLSTNLYGNPHSASPTSLTTADRIANVRSRILEFLDAPRGEYSVVFTSGATAAFKLTAECIPWQEGHVLTLYRPSNHTSVLGMRLALESQGLASQIRSVDQSEFDVDMQDGLVNLIVYPAQCNFSGSRFPLDWSLSRNTSSRVMLDASSYLASSRISLKQHPFQAVVFSPYKIFGYPTGVGCLVMKTSLLQMFRKRYFGGGAVSAVAADAHWQVFRPDTGRFEDGTLNFLDILALEHCFNFMDAINWDKLQARVHGIAEECRMRMRGLSHGNKSPVVQFYETGDSLGPIIAFNLLSSDGTTVGYNSVATLASINNIHLRVGCFCNPAACQTYLGLSAENVKDNYEIHGHVCGDSKDIVDGHATGAIRISFGMSSSIKDIDSWMSFLRTFFVETYQPVIQPADSLGASKVQLAKVRVFPIKACSWIEVNGNWPIAQYGLLYDRLWMVVDEDGNALGQKRHPKMCLVKPRIDLLKQTMTITAPGMPELTMMLQNSTTTTQCGRVCGAPVAFIPESDQVASWFTNYLGIRASLAASTMRIGDLGSKIAFANQSQFLMLNQASFDALQSAATEHLSIDAFRANFIVQRLEAWQEEALIGQMLQLGTQTFKVVRNCVRCQVICINQETAERTREPLSCLSLLCKQRGKRLWFGVYLEHDSATSTWPFVVQPQHDMNVIPPISQLSQSSQDLETAVSVLFEPSPVLVRQIQAKLAMTRINSYSELIQIVETEILPALSWTDKLDVVNAHPRLGESKTQLSAFSYKEQGYTTSNAINSPSADDQLVNAKLHELNRAYEDKFGFKYVVFVNGRPRREIIPLMEAAIEGRSTPEQQMQRGLTEMGDIARDRLSKLSTPSSS